MLATTHVLVGAGAGKVVHNPSSAFLMSIILHFLTDKIPHYWPYSQKSKKNLTLIDWFIAISILILFVLFPIPNKSSVIAGAFGGLSVDILLVGVPFFRRSKIGLWHSTRQPHKTSALFIVTDLILIIPLSIYLLVEAI